MAKPIEMPSSCYWSKSGASYESLSSARLICAKRYCSVDSLPTLGFWDGHPSGGVNRIKTRCPFLFLRMIAKHSSRLNRLRAASLLLRNRLPERPASCRLRIAMTRRLQRFAPVVKILGVSSCSALTGQMLSQSEHELFVCLIPSNSIYSFLLNYYRPLATGSACFCY